MLLYCTIHGVEGVQGIGLRDYRRLRRRVECPVFVNIPVIRLVAEVCLHVAKIRDRLSERHFLCRIAVTHKDG